LKKAKKTTPPEFTVTYVHTTEKRVRHINESKVCNSKEKQKSQLLQHKIDFFLSLSQEMLDPKKKSINRIEYAIRKHLAKNIQIRSCITKKL